MYELTKQKSRNYYIVLGIIVFALITLFLKLAFNEPPRTINDDLVSAANEINSHAPIIVDSSTRFDNVAVLPGNTFQYNYTLTSILLTQLDTNQFRTLMRASLIEQTKKNPKISVFRDNGVTIQAKYVDKNGEYVSTITAYPNEY